VWFILTRVLRAWVEKLDKKEMKNRLSKAILPDTSIEGLATQSISFNAASHARTTSARSAGYVQWGGKQDAFG
jgi:hypothetical protein